MVPERLATQGPDWEIGSSGDRLGEIAESISGIIKQEQVLSFPVTFGYLRAFAIL